MKTYAKCERCGEFAEMPQFSEQVGTGRLPQGWFRVVVAEEKGPNVGVNPAEQVVLCGTCAPVVGKAIQAAVARRT